MTDTQADILPPGAKFSLGRIIISQATKAILPAETIACVLERHRRGDWGDAGCNTTCDNAESLRNGGPVFSFYFKRGPHFTITTSADRTTTTITTLWDRR